MKLTHRRSDGSFLALVNGNPYHIIEGDPSYWKQAQIEAAELGDDLFSEPERVAPPLAADDYSRAIQALVDQTAKTRRYSDSGSCASYVNSTNPAWAAEAQAFVAWRDAVWAHAYAELANVEAGQRPQPSVEEFLGEMPAMVWPQG